MRDERFVGGKVRKYYDVTDEGRVALAEACQKIGELVHEVLEGHGSRRLSDPPTVE